MYQTSDVLPWFYTASASITYITPVNITLCVVAHSLGAVIIQYWSWRMRFGLWTIVVVWWTDGHSICIMVEICAGQIAVLVTMYLYLNFLYFRCLDIVCMSLSLRPSIYINHVMLQAVITEWLVHRYTTVTRILI